MDVKRILRSCDVCQRMKSGRQNQGLPQPLTVPEQPWQHIGMDLIVSLPGTQRGFDSIYTFVDRLRPAGGVKHSDSDLVETRMVSAKKALR